MKKTIVLLLVLGLLCACMTVLAEESGITLEVNTARIPVYAADDPYLDGLAAEGNTLPVLLISARKTVYLQVNVTPRTVRNKKVTLSVDNEAVVQVRGTNLAGLKPGEAVLTIASQEDPSVTLQYRIVVVQPVKRIALTADAKSVAVGGTMALTPACLPEDATRKRVTWESANEQIATVDANGVVTGVKRGNTRITAVATDGSNVRASINIAVTQSAEEILLEPAELTVDVRRGAVIRATVFPKDANNKKVIWSSSDESVATVNASGRITGVALGDCEITCVSEENGAVQAKAVVHVQQPVLKVAFGEAPSVYNGESAQLTWTIEPANASNPTLKFSSTDERIATVSEDGIITGIAGGDVYIRAVTTDGSNRQAKIKVSVWQHLTGVHILRKVAYVDRGETAAAGAILEPEKTRNINPNMSWESADTSVATVVPDKQQSNRFRITGVNYGETTVTGTTEDGGFQDSILVKIGDWGNSLKWEDGRFDARGNLRFSIKNNSSLNITSITLEMECFDFDGKPQKVNTKNGSNVVKVVYNKALKPGKTTPEDEWKPVNYDKAGVNMNGMAAIRVRIAEFQIDHDWVKVVPKGNRRMKITYDPHKVLK